MRFFVAVRDLMRLRKVLAHKNPYGPTRFITLSCLTLDEEDLRRIAAKKLGLPQDAPIEEVLEKGKNLFVSMMGQS